MLTRVCKREYRGRNRNCKRLRQTANPFHRCKREIMASLALPSLEVQRFHGFQDLRIEKLGRVNLIVGKNNIGKSSLLQAIQLYAVRGFPTAIWQLLETRDELKGRPVIQTPEEALLSLKYLFFGRKEIASPIDPITIGPIDNPEQ